jgi:hypothetical protein
MTQHTLTRFFLNLAALSPKQDLKFCGGKFVSILGCGVQPSPIFIEREKKQRVKVMAKISFHALFLTERATAKDRNAAPAPYSKSVFVLPSVLDGLIESRFCHRNLAFADLFDHIGLVKSRSRSGLP